MNTVTNSFVFIISDQKDTALVGRYIQLALQLEKNGHYITFVTPDGSIGSSHEIKAAVIPFRDLLLHEFDAAMISEISVTGTLLLCRSTLKIFYALTSDSGIRELIQFPEIEFFTENRDIISFLNKLTKKSLPEVVNTSELIVYKKTGILPKLKKSASTTVSEYVGEKVRSAQGKKQSVSLSHSISQGYQLSFVNKSHNNLQKLPPGVYIFCYHGVAPAGVRDEWEKAYGDVITDTEKFEQHITWLHKEAEFTTLTNIKGLLECGVDKPYFAVTFDDGFRNVVSHAKPVLDTFGIKPAVFVNSAYSIDGGVFHRVLASVLASRGHAKTLLKSIESAYGSRLRKRHNVLKAMKRDYRYGITEKAVEDAWRVHNKTLPQDIYLSAGEIRALVKSGWEIGNHTHSHVKLSALTEEQQHFEIEHCAKKLTDAGIEMIPWIAYPYGAASDVNDATTKILSSNDAYNGAFCNSGINVFQTRTQWLRLGIGNQSLEQFITTVQDGVARTPGVIF